MYCCALLAAAPAGKAEHVVIPGRVPGPVPQAFLVFPIPHLRGILAAGTALAISLLVGPAMIRRLNYYQVGQAVRDDGPKSHLSKSGTPTMGAR